MEFWGRTINLSIFRVWAGLTCQHFHRIDTPAHRKIIHTCGIIWTPTCRFTACAVPPGPPLHKTRHINVSDSKDSGQCCPSQSICPVLLSLFTHWGGCQNTCDYYTRKSGHLTCRSMPPLTDGSPIKMNGSLEGGWLCLVVVKKEKGSGGRGCNRAGCQGHLVDSVMTQWIRVTPVKMIQKALTRGTNVWVCVACGAIAQNAAVHDDCCWLKRPIWDQANARVASWRPTERLQGQTDHCEAPPAAAASCPSIRAGEQICGDFGIKCSLRMSGWHTVNAGHLLSGLWEVTRSCSL